MHTSIGAELNRQRVLMVEKHTIKTKVVDIGIGSGHFILMRDQLVQPNITYGYDVNPKGIQWLLDRNIWFDPWYQEPEIATFWDSFEHLPRPTDLLKQVTKFVFVSIPIFKGKEHILGSKHFKPNEHIWYFTRNGLINYFSRNGFDLVEENLMETELGREDIGSFAFKRI
jgi:hypothetical protein